MKIIIDNLYTIWLIIFIFTTLNIIKVSFLFIQALIRERNGSYVYYENKFKLQGKELMYFGISLSYFITYIIWLIK